MLCHKFSTTMRTASPSKDGSWARLDRACIETCQQRACPTPVGSLEIGEKRMGSSGDQRRQPGHEVQALPRSPLSSLLL